MRGRTDKQDPIRVKNCKIHCEEEQKANRKWGGKFCKTHIR